MSRDPLLYLQEIIDAIAYIRSFTHGMSQDAFVADRKTQMLAFATWKSSGRPPRTYPTLSSSERKMWSGGKSQVSATC